MTKCRFIQAISLGVFLSGTPLFAPIAAFAQEASFGGTFQDVPIDHWAFLNVELLVRKYKVMAGFPEGTFKGSAPVSRYEMAAALDKVVERMELLKSKGASLPVADVVVAKDVAISLSFDDKLILDRLGRLENALKPLQDAKSLAPVTLTGSVGTDFVDNTQDAQAPFLKTSMAVTLKTSVMKDFDLSASLGGGMPAATAGNKPATAGSGKPPDGKFSFNNAFVTSHPAGSTFRFGMFRPSGLFSVGTELDNHWGGIVGNGFVDPEQDTTRWTDKNAAIAASREFGPVKLAGAVTPVLVLGGLDWQVNNFVRLKLCADTDQPNWGNLGDSKKAVASNFYSVVDVGSDKLGVSLQGGIAKDLYQASLDLLWSPVGAYQLGLAAVYRNSDKGVSEITPGLFIYLPAFADWSPNITLSVKEPQVIATPKGNTGPGSLLGQQAGVSSLFVWPLAGKGFPNIRFEYNIQQPVLFYPIYDATFACSIARDF